MENRKKACRVKARGVAAVVAASLLLGGGAASAWSPLVPTSPPDPSTASNAQPSYREQINPDGSCDLVDSNGVPLYDSQFTQRTGSSPCDQG